MQGLAQQISHYQRSHQKKNTQLTHYIGMPLLWFSFLIVLGWVHIGIPTVFTTHFAWLVSLAMVAYYVRCDWMLALGLAAALLVLNFFAGFVSQPYPSLFGLIFFLITFVAGAALLYVGHTIEGNKPSYMDYVHSVISAPICLVAEVFFKFGHKQDLKNEVEKQS